VRVNSCFLAQDNSHTQIKKFQTLLGALYKRTMANAFDRIENGSDFRTHNLWVKVTKDWHLHFAIIAYLARLSRQPKISTMRVSVNGL
jgi:hypothetical protein